MTFIYRKTTFAAAAATMAAMCLLASCGGGGGGGSNSGQGTLAVSLTDAPACGFNEVNVTVSKVRVHRSDSAQPEDSGWTEIALNPARKINLLDLTNGVMESLGQTALPAGHYTQLRLVLSPNSSSDPFANSVVLSSGGGEIALATPSGITSGIKLNGNFDIAEGSTTSLALDFDACKSIVKRGNSGNYGLKPVISIIPMTSGGVSTVGTVEGYVDPTMIATDKPVISAQVNGQIVRSTVPAADGKFTLAPLGQGNYTIVVTADNHASGVIGGVPVTASATTAVSTSAAPIALTTSTPMPTVSGAVTPAAAQGLVSATQTFASGPKVTIKYQNADVTTGDYSMTLPFGAPKLGQYGPGTLPIVFNEDATLAGKYAIEATASGYQPQSTAVDVSSTDATNINFALIQ